MTDTAVIEGVEIRRLSRYSDRRGWLLELFRQDEIDDRQLPLMAYISMTLPGIARGPHEHRHQTDIICFTGPSEFALQMWDNRSDSPTFGKNMTVKGGQENPIAVIIPPGVVHAYRNVGNEDGLVINAPNKLYAGDGKNQAVDEIRYEDRPDSPFRLEI